MHFLLSDWLLVELHVLVAPLDADGLDALCLVRESWRALCALRGGRVRVRHHALTFHQAVLRGRASYARAWVVSCPKVGSIRLSTHLLASAVTLELVR